MFVEEKQQHEQVKETIKLFTVAVTRINWIIFVFIDNNMR